MPPSVHVLPVSSGNSLCNCYLAMLKVMAQALDEWIVPVPSKSKAFRHEIQQVAAVHGISAQLCDGASSGCACAFLAIALLEATFFGVVTACAAGGHWQHSLQLLCEAGVECPRWKALRATAVRWRRRKLPVT